MKRSNLSVLVAIVTGLVLSGCGGSGSDYNEPAPAPPPPPTATQTNFTAFTRMHLGSSMTTDTASPTEVEELEWAFTDDDDETEYDDVIATSM